MRGLCVVAVGCAWAGLAAAGCEHESASRPPQPPEEATASERATRPRKTDAPAPHAPVAAVAPSQPAPTQTVGSGVPAENAPSLTAAPPIPPAEGAQVRAAQLLRAIATDDPALAAPFFFPREAFLRVKAIPNPERYWQRLYARYEEDIHTLHATLPGIARAKFVRLALSKRSEWMPVASEGNHLPYWAVRHNALHYEVDGRPAQLEVRVLIHWGPDWYVTHLREFRDAAAR